MTAPEALDALLALYGRYLDDYRQRVIDNGPFHGLQKFLLGNSSPADRRADAAFYSAVEQSAAALAALPDTDGQTAGRAVRYMILEADGVDDSSRLMIEAAQALAIPLLPRLSAGERPDILAAYKARYPRLRCLSPRQRELLRALERE